MKNILLLTDFSNNAYNALFYATQLLKHQECNFHVLNAYTEKTPLLSISTGGANKPLLQQLKEEAMEGLQHTYHRIQLDNNNPKHTFKIRAIKQPLSEAVSSCIKKDAIELIVMGNQGVTSAKAIFLGSNVIHTVNTANNCAVLVVPKEIEHKIPYEIAFATDYNRNYDAAQLAPLLNIASICSAAVRIVHINEEERLSEQQLANLNTLKKYFERTPHSVHWMPDFRTKTAAIQTFLNELGIGMLSMVNYKQGFVDQIMREPVIKKISFSINVPFLILPAGD